MPVDSISNKPVAYRPPQPEIKPAEKTEAPQAPVTAAEPKKNEVIQDGFETEGKTAKPDMALGDVAQKGVVSAKDNEKVADLGESKKSEKTEGPAPERKSLSGEDAAKKQVELPTVASARKGVEETQKAVKDDTSKKMDDLFAMADGKKDVPKGMEVKKTEDGRVELRQKDDKGELSEFTVATRGKDGEMTLDSASFKDGVNSRERIEVKKDGGTQVENASWKDEKNKTGDLRSLGEIKDSRDPDVTYKSNKVGMERDDKQDRLVQNTVSMEGGGVKGSRTTYGTQNKSGEWIDNKLKGPFDLKKSVDLATTMSYEIPPPGADGKQEPATFNKSHTFSQGSVAATSTVERKLDGHTQYIGKGNHTAADMEKVRGEYAKNKGEQYDADDAYKKGQAPKQWVVMKKNSENSLDTQTFLEGQPKVTAKTHTEVDGSRVKQTTEGKTLKPGSKKADEYVDIKGESTSTYAKDGSLEKMDSSRKDPDGTQVEEHYNSKREATDKGLKLDESMESKKTKDGKTFTSKQEDSSLLSGEGVKLLNSKNTLTNPDGVQAVTEVGEKGEKMTVSGPGGKDPREITDPKDLGDNEVAKDLVINSAASVSSSIAEVARKGGVNALTALQGFSKGLGDSKSFLPPSLAKAAGGAEKVSQAAQYAKGGAAGVFGAASVAAGVAGLVDGIQDNNKGAIFKGLVDTGLGVKGLYDGEEALRLAFKGSSDLVDIMGDDVAKTGGYFKTVGGWLGESAAGAVGKLGATSAVAKLGGALKGLGGVANVAGAVAGTVTGAMDIAAGVKGGHTGQIASGALGIVGGVGGAAVGVLAASAFGGPIGLAAGALVGGLIFAGQKITELIADDKHQIAKLGI